MDQYEVIASNDKALFSLKLHRGDGMLLLGMNWKTGKPSADFVGFAIEYKEPGGQQYFAVKNRLSFTEKDGNFNPESLSTRLSPIQKFRWIHFPRNADMKGSFTYRVTPVFMGQTGELSYGETQEANIALQRDTYEGQLNVAYTRGFVSSQAFVDRYTAAAIPTLLPAQADDGLTFKPTNPKAEEALAWMGFEARSAILEVLDNAIADSTAQVSVAAYDLNEPGVLERLEKLGNRLRVIIDDSGSHGDEHSAESQATTRLIASAGAGNVQRQHMRGLQHNKTIVAKGQQINSVVCGSTNFSWRGFFVQANNAIILHGDGPVKLFQAAFENYWENKPASFASGASADWQNLGLDKIDAQVTFSPHGSKNAALDDVTKDIALTESSLLFSLAFLYQTPGSIQDMIKTVATDPAKFVYGISDKEVTGLSLTTPNGKSTEVYPSALGKTAPPPFHEEPSGGGGTRMHHKFVVIDFDKPTARVYMGSYNFSQSADHNNGENLLLIRDRRVAVSYTVEALRMFDHYQFRIKEKNSKDANSPLVLAKPPQNAGEHAWWESSYSDQLKIRDRVLFS
ncbi:phospholipase D-like domain-containing protein [Undibacterium sp. Di26W]|uniref:phospholipase D-like domain-containing protein n=1 Tax=Undibacterium sp. Di26W TaxID=3413035 RepID=UPI003BEFC07D